MGSTNKASSAWGCSYPEPSFSEIKEHNNTYSNDHISSVLYLPRPVHDATDVMYFNPDKDRGNQDALKWTGTWSRRAVPTLKRPSCPRTRVVFGGGLLCRPPALKIWPKCLHRWKTGGRGQASLYQTCHQFLPSLNISWEMATVKVFSHVISMDAHWIKNKMQTKNNCSNVLHHAWIVHHTQSWQNYESSLPVLLT